MGGVPISFPDSGQTNGAPQQTGAQKAQAIITALSSLMGKLGGVLGKSGGGGGPLVSPGIVGQVPQMPGAPGQPQRQAAPIGAPSQTQIPSTNVQSGLFQTGFEFSNPSARNAAVTTSAIQGVSDFISKVKAQKQAKTQKQAENYMTQIMAAQQSGDKQTLDMLLEDPKVVKTLEKGLEFIIPKVPGEPPPPEATGMMAAIKKITGHGQKQNQNARLPAPNTPGGVMWPRMPQAAANEAALKDITSGAALNKVQSDPELAAVLGVGTGLSGKEATDAERYQAGLTLAPAEEKRAFMAHQEMLDKFGQENKQLLMQIASSEKIATAKMSSEERQTRISTGPLYYRAKIAKDIADSQIKIRQAVMNGKVGEANKIAMQTLTSQINTLRSAASKLEKDNPDMAKDFMKQADERQKQYDELQQSNELNVDKIVEDILNQP